jgi:hypothetical protein
VERLDRGRKVRKVSMGARSRAKGKRGEREIVALARGAGLPAKRTWHTAQDADPLVRCCDVMICGHRAQVRVRGNGFKPVYDALEGVEIAFLRADRQAWLAVMPATRVFALLKSEKGSRDG